MKISIAMTTYNGEKYILSQLESILHQTRRPDEVIILDDNSTDNCFSIINGFIKKNKLDNWFLKKNDVNIGWKNNFYEAVKMTTGDIIFFSDQDDIWELDKIQIMSEKLIVLNAGCIYADKKIIDSANNRIKDREQKNKYSNKTIKITLKPSFFSAKALGCTMCINRFVANKYLELGCKNDGHDSQCARIACLYSSLYYYDSQVIQYRIHTNNTSGVNSNYSFGSSSIESRVANIKSTKNWLQCLLDDKSIYNYHKLIASCIKFENKRLKYFQSHKVLFISLLFKFKYYLNFSMLIGDFSYKHKLNEKMGRIRWKFRRKTK